MGRHYAQQLIERGTTKVYATARDAASMDVPGVVPLELDITDDASVAAAVTAAGDVDLLINNAGVSTYSTLVTGGLDKIHQEMDTHFFGTLRMVRAFAPVLAAHGGGAILNVCSALSWFSTQGAFAYSSAKAAQWSLTNSIRLELAGQRTQVTALHVGAVDTDMMSGFDVPKADPAVVVASALDGVQAGDFEVLADDASVQVKLAVSDPRAFYGPMLEAR